MAMWCGDDAGYDEPTETPSRGDAILYSPDDEYPAIRHPIGFMRTRPRVRVKAWMQPIIEDQS